MYLEFPIHTFNDRTNLELDLRTWSERYNIAYRSKYIKHTLRVTFDDNASYSFFAVTWNPKSSRVLEYQLIEPMKVDNR